MPTATVRATEGQGPVRNNDRIIRPAEACEIANFSISSLRRYSAQPNFPKKIKYTNRCVGFWLSDFLRWLESRGEW